MDAQPRACFALLGSPSPEFIQVWRRSTAPGVRTREKPPPTLATFGISATFARQEFTLGCDKSLVAETNGWRIAEFETRASHTCTGANVGAGVLYRFNDRLSGGVEYRYTHLDSIPVTLTDPNYPAVGRRNFNTDYSSVTLMLNYHF